VAMIDKLLRGEIKNYKVVIPEDLSMREIAARLDEFN
jgi:2-C-methyl-D-erythritol 4-phosphate cytidylyltransferase